MQMVENPYHSEPQVSQPSYGACSILTSLLMSVDVRCGQEGHRAWARWAPTWPCPGEEETQSGKEARLCKYRRIKKEKKEDRERGREGKG